MRAKISMENFSPLEGPQRNGEESKVDLLAPLCHNGQFQAPDPLKMR